MDGRGLNRLVRHARVRYARVRVTKCANMVEASGEQKGWSTRRSLHKSERVARTRESGVGVAHMDSRWSQDAAALSALPGG